MSSPRSPRHWRVDTHAEASSDEEELLDAVMVRPCCVAFLSRWQRRIRPR
jgi:hypothetical protein